MSTLEEIADLTRTLRAVDAVMADALEQFVEIEQSADISDLGQRERDGEELTPDERATFEAFQELYHVALLVNYRADYWAGGSIVADPEDVARRYNLPDEFVKYAEMAIARNESAHEWDRKNLSRIRDLERQMFELLTEDV